MSVQALVQAPVLYNNPEIQKETLSASQGLVISTAAVAKEALEQAAEISAQQELCLDDLLCSQLWVQESEKIISNVQDTEKKAELTKICARHQHKIDSIIENLSKPNLAQVEIIRYREKLEKSAKARYVALMADMSSTEKLKQLFESFATRSANLKEMQTKAKTATYSDKSALGSELLIHRTLLKTVNAAHIELEQEITNFVSKGSEHRKCNEIEYQTLVKGFSENASMKFELELGDQLLTKRLNTIPKGNDLADKFEKLTPKLENNPNTEIGRFNYTYVKTDQEEKFMQETLTAQNEFFKYTNAAVAYKKIVSELLKNFNLAERDERFQTEIAFGDQKQADLNRQNFKKLRADAEALKGELTTEINKTWQKICANQSNFLTKLTVCQEAINRKIVDKKERMFFYSEGRIEGLIKGTGYKNINFELNADLNAEEKIPDAYPFLSLEKAEVKAEAEAQQAVEAPVETIVAEEKQEEANVNEAAVASQIDATKAAIVDTIDEENEIIDLEFISKA